MAEDRCICCGEIVPEGTAVCNMCMKGTNKMKNTEKIINRNTDPEVGPLDGVTLEAKGSLTVFGTGEEEGTFSMELHDCKIMASVETGTFSISMRDACGIMMAVRIDEAVEVLAAALEIARDIAKGSEQSEQPQKTEEDKVDE